MCAEDWAVICLIIKLIIFSSHSKVVTIMSVIAIDRMSWTEKLLSSKT